MIFQRSDSELLHMSVDALRPGMFVQLELGWLDHPFSRSRFRLESQAQIDTLRSLGQRQVKVRRDLSDPDAFAPKPEGAGAASVGAQGGAEALPLAPTAEFSAAAVKAEPPPPSTPSPTAQEAAVTLELELQRRCEQSHARANQAWSGIAQDVVNNPVAAHQAALNLAQDMTRELQDEHTTLRLLGQCAGCSASQHAVNVTVLALMLGRHLGLSGTGLSQLALGALMHDVGKQMLSADLLAATRQSASPEVMLRERSEHVIQGVRLGRAMGMDASALRIVAQHHELSDGSGAPKGLHGEEIDLGARIVAVVDRYDRLCNPGQGQPPRTPHEAQAQLFAQMRHQYDGRVLAAFVKMLGVYPPGSIIELSSGQIAMVISSKPSQSLRPVVTVHDPQSGDRPRPPVDLSQRTDLSIRRSLHPQHLPRSVLDALSPPMGVQYYFAHPEHAARDLSMAA